MKIQPTDPDPKIVRLKDGIILIVAAASILLSNAIDDGIKRIIRKWKNRGRNSQDDSRVPPVRPSNIQF